MRTLTSSSPLLICDQIYLVRHGHCEGSDSRILGTSSAELSPAGRGQAAHSAQELPAECGPDLLVSPLRRAQQTAAIIGRYRGWQPQVEPGLAEVGVGWWEGLERTEIIRRWPSEYEAWSVDPWTPVCGREPKTQVERRVGQVLASLGHGRPVIVGHATWFLAMLGVLGIDLAPNDILTWGEVVEVRAR